MKRKTPITPYQLRKLGMYKQGNRWRVYIPSGRFMELVYDSEEQSLHLYNVYLNFLRKVKYIEQIQAVYKAITDKVLPSQPKS